MNKTELKKKLTDISSKLNTATNGKWFVSSIIIDNLNHEILDSIAELNNLEIEPREENGIQFCGVCDQKVSKKRRRIEKTMITGLMKALKHYETTWEHVFFKRDIWLNPVEYTLMSYLVWFWLLYKDENMTRGEFWIPVKRVIDFLKWEYSIAEYYEIDPMLKEGEEGYRVHSENRILITAIPTHQEIVKQYAYTIEYIDNQFENAN